MSATETPSGDQGRVERFEFELPEEKRIYRISRDGMAAIKFLGEGSTAPNYALEKRGVVDAGWLSYLQSESGPLSEDSTKGKSDFEVALGYLILCQNVANKLLENKELWGIHIENILAFYLDVKGQSDTILARTVEFHPIFQDYRLRAISTADEQNMRLAASRALENALKSV